MKFISLITLCFLILLLGCNQTETKTPEATNEVVDTVAEATAVTEKEEHPEREEDIEEVGALSEEKIANINSLLELFKLNNVKKIADQISFPLHRQYPIPSIKNKPELMKRFNEVFDSVLIQQIVNSRIEQWSDMGWRGIMLEDGTVWLTNSGDFITNVNYQSDFEKKLRRDLVVKDKENLHTSLKNFENPIHKIMTNTSLIRIDEFANHTYRFTSWKIGEAESTKPDIMIEKGEVVYEGSGGNHIFIFKRKNETFKVYRNIIGEDNTPDITLEVEKNGKINITEEGVLVD
jgi:hypothetical protein